MYSLSPKLKMYSIGAIVLGIILFAIGYGINKGISETQVQQMALSHNIDIINGPKSNSAQILDRTPQQHLHTAVQQVHNRPMASLLQISLLVFGVSAAALFFYAMQTVAHAGWPIVVMRVMEAVASVIPYGGAMVLILVLINTGGFAHLYHWMDGSLTDPNSPNFDSILYERSKKFLNIPFYIIRTLIYVGGATFFLWKLRSLSKSIDKTKSRKQYASFYSWSVGYVIFFSIASAVWAWDWMMSIDTHWYSTMYIWYTMTSFWATAVPIIILISIMLKKKGLLPEFNDNHLHSLGLWTFATSLVWSYCWFCQFMLYWYANIPEEANYFWGRFEYYQLMFLLVLIPNLFFPLIVMMSAGIKKRYKFMIFASIFIIIGHWFDLFLIVMPGTVGPFWHIGLLEIGATLFGLGLFVLVCMTALSRVPLLPVGNPYLKESKLYESAYESR